MLDRNFYSSIENNSIQKEGLIPEGPPFTPYIGNESTIKSQEPTKGSVWFAKDTRKIFYSDGTQFLSMGGNSSIFYGISNEKEPVENDIYIFFPEEIDGNNEIEDGNYKLPNVDDLILNKDGCFYRVISVEKNEEQITVISAKKLTLAGGGGGGSFGPTSGSITLKDSNLIKTVISGQKCEVDFTLEGTKSNGDPGEDGIYTIRAAKNVTSPVLKTGTFNNLEKTVIDITDLIIPNKKNEFYLFFAMNLGGFEATTAGPAKIIIDATEVTLKWDYDETSINYTNNPLPLKWQVTGSKIQHQATITIDDMFIINVPQNESEFIIDNPNDYGLNHGAHKISLSVKVSLDSINNESLDDQNKMFIMCEPGNSSGILSVGLYNTKLTQYNTVYIPIYFYSLNNNGNNAIITLLEDEIVKDEWENVKNCELKIWPYTPTSAGIHTLNISANHNTQSITIPIEVESLNIDNKEVSGYAFKFDAKDFASNNAVQNWDSNGIKASFSEKFDWINGGLKTERDENNNNRQLICIKAGSEMTINYNLFKDLFSKGKTFKIIFKTTKCRDYDASFLKCKENKKMISVNNKEAFIIENGPINYSKYISLENNQQLILTNPIQLQEIDYSDIEELEKMLKYSYIEYDNLFYYVSKVEEGYLLCYSVTIEDKFIGLEMKAQSTEFISLNSSANGAITVPYCEDSYIEFEIDISKLNTNGRGIIKTWLDGIPASMQTYTSYDIFTHETDQKIVIGSMDCDTYIYMIKVYEKGLTNDEHLQNFIADASNGEEMIKRFRRNDILDTEYHKGEISPTKLAERNPNCRVHVYEVPNMVQGKDMPVPGCKYKQYHGSKEEIIYSEDCTIEAQGTSSMSYGLAAFNIDTDFTNDGETECTLYAGDKQLIDGWSMNKNSIPCTYFNTKVNVASSEQANNALNQEWYHRFQPYKSVLRCKNEKARDTMEFTPGVLFIQDNNKMTNSSSYVSNNVFKEIPGYVNNPFPKLYSICNMGNSKKNTHVLHGGTDVECCVEVSDNQMPQQWMVDDQFVDENIDPEEGSPFQELFGFRYPRKRKKASPEQIQAWKDFVSWMARRNPQPKYEKLIIDNEESYNKAINKYSELYTFDIENNPEAKHIISEEYNPSVKEYYRMTEHVYGYTEEKLESEERFDPYTFTGYICDSEIQKDYTPLVKGYTISTYSTYKQVPVYKTDDKGNIVYNNDGTPVVLRYETKDEPYTHDTYEYRMAKMLSECEEHLVMDSVIYHYLFIERHCMIDNVAKNTFWSSEDLKRWNLTKNYDNDTADGNDNNGKFTRNYGMEPTDNLNNVEKVFNANQSVWFNFVHGLSPVCESMYRKLEKAKVVVDGITYENAWDPKAYLKAFNDWQSAIPERCWIESYYRTYERPYEVYGDNMYLSMVMGGQKKHQREQYETYQNHYMSSKYFGGDVSESFITIRGSGDNKKGHILPIKMYADCYVRGALGSGFDPNVKIRAKRNEFVDFECPLNNLNNVTFYLFAAYFYSQIGSTDKKYIDKGWGTVNGYSPAQLTFSAAPKLRTLVLGTEEEDDRNEGLTTEIAFQNNDLLEEVYACNFVENNQPLDLSNSPNLKVLIATNSAFNNISIANNAPLTDLLLEKPAALVLKNLKNVNNFKINYYGALSVLDIDNIDDSPGLNSKDLVANAINMKSLSRYYLNNVKWKITDPDEISYNSNEQQDILELLEQLTLKRTLLNQSASNQNAEDVYYTKAESLVGNLDIMPEAYNKSSDDSIKIYNRYSDKERFYPNLNINFNNDNSKLYKINIYDGDGLLVWHKKIQPNKILNEDFFKDGPNGEFTLDLIQKTSDTQYTYAFNNKWKVYSDKSFKNEVYLEDINNSLPINNKQIQQDLYLVPQFTSTIRTYTITFYDFDTVFDGKIMYKELKQIVCNVGTSIKEIIPIKLPYRDESNLQNGECYKFMGYTTTAPVSDQDKSMAINHEIIIVKDNMKFYPVFKKINLNESKYYLDESQGNYFGPEKYFVINKINNSNSFIYQDIYDEIEFKEEGISISPNKKVWEDREKCRIVIPSLMNGKKVLEISGFSGSEQNDYYSHIYCDQDSNLLSIASRCCASSSGQINNLEIFDYPESLRVIKSYAFQGNKSLKSADFRKCSNLKEVQTNAFNQAFSTSLNNGVLWLPSSLKQLQNLAFSFLPPKGLNLKIGSNEEKSLLDLSATPSDGSTTYYQVILQNGKNSMFSSVTIWSNIYNNFDDVVMTLKDGTKITFSQCIGPCNTDNYIFNPKTE